MINHISLTTFLVSAGGGAAEPLNCRGVTRPKDKKLYNEIEKIQLRLDGSFSKARVA